MRKALGACALVTLSSIPIALAAAGDGSSSRPAQVASPVAVEQPAPAAELPAAEPPPEPTQPPAPEPPPVIPVDVALWERIHECEQRDSWYAYGYFGNGLRGGGGLGMSDGAWAMAINAARSRGVELPGFVLDATPFEQMTAAQAFLDRYGWGWGCR